MVILSPDFLNKMYDFPPLLHMEGKEGQENVQES